MNRAPSRARQRGVALVLVLWSFMTLGVLALDFSRWMREDAKAGVNFAEEAQGYYAAYAGMQIALYKASGRLAGGGGSNVVPSGGVDEGDEEQKPVQAETGTFHGMSYAVEVRPECGRIPINGIAARASSSRGGGAAVANSADREFLKRLITNLSVGGNAAVDGVDRREAARIDEIVDSIIDWIDQGSDPEPSGAEWQWYRDHGGYRPANGLLSTPEELLNVRGMTPELFYGSAGRPGLRDVVAVWCGRGKSVEESFGGSKIDGESVDFKVLQVLLPDMTPDELARLKGLRDSGDRIGFRATLLARLSADPVLSSKFEFETDRVTPVEVTARADTSRDRNQSVIKAVYVLSNDVPEPVMWYDRAPFTGAMPRSEMREDGS